MTTEELRGMLIEAFPAPAYSILHEVRASTGYDKAQGYADALIMSLWPSRGIELIGVEIKNSRSDWLREKKDPSKAEKFAQYCHRWYLVTANDVTNATEIPAGWGWMAAVGKKLKIVKEAPALTPVSPDWRFMASIFRNAGQPVQGMVARSEINELLAEKRKECVAEFQEKVNAFTERYQAVSKELNELKRNLEYFSQVSGVSLHQWQLSEDQFRKEADLLRLFRNGGKDNLIKEVEQSLAGLKTIIKGFDNFIQGT